MRVPQVTGRRSFALVVTLLLATLLAASGAGVALTAMTESVTTAWVARDLDHRLALDSLLNCLPRILESQQSTGSQYEKNRRKRLIRLSVGRCDVRCFVQSEETKLQVGGVLASLPNRLLELARSNGLPIGNVKLMPIAANNLPDGPRYVWFDQVIASTGFEEVFRRRRLDAASVSEGKTWSDLLSFWGGTGGNPLAVDVETRIGNDVRRWYAVIVLRDGQVRVIYECSV